MVRANLSKFLVGPKIRKLENANRTRNNVSIQYWPSPEPLVSLCLAGSLQACLHQVAKTFREPYFTFMKSIPGKT